MGGALLQQVNKDTQRFAFKCSHATVEGQSVDVYKDPITDMGKRSKRGKLDLVVRLEKGKQVISTVPGDSFGSLLKLVFENGVIKKEFTLDEVRRNCAEFS